MRNEPTRTPYYIRTWNWQQEQARIEGIFFFLNDIFLKISQKKKKKETKEKGTNSSFFLLFVFLITLSSDCDCKS